MKLTATEAREIVAMSATATQSEIAERYNVNRETVSHIVAGRYWSHVTGINFAQRNTKRGRPRK